MHKNENYETARYNTDPLLFSSLGKGNKKSECSFRIRLEGRWSQSEGGLWFGPNAE